MYWHSDYGSLVTDCLLETTGPSVGDEEPDLGVGKEGGLGEPGGEEDIVRSIRHLSLPLPHHSLLQSRGIGMY